MTAPPTPTHRAMISRARTLRIAIKRHMEQGQWGAARVAAMRLAHVLGELADARAGK